MFVFRILGQLFYFLNLKSMFGRLVFISKCIKREWYYFSRVINPKYSPACKLSLKCYFRYIKNKFFGNYLATRVAPFVFSPQSDFELHILSQKGNLWMAVWSLNSFLFHSGLRPKIVIHSDGTIDKKSAKVLKEKFSGLEIISREEADEYIFNRPDISEKVKKMRRTKNNLLLKLIDIPLLSQGKKTMIMGDDVLFYSRPQEIIDFIEGKTSYAALVSENHGRCELGVNESYLSKHKLIERRTDFINSDLLLFDEGCVTPAAINEYFENSVKDENFYLLEMAGLSCVLAQSNFSFLPLDRYHIKGSITEKTVVKHFTSPRRQDLFAYGIDVSRESIRKNGK